MFNKILIANRGEIACRVIRTCRRFGIATVAVYSEADAAALHAELADEAYLIGPAPARESYLRGEVIIETALKAGAEAIHPGFGFLSENAEFAAACAAAGLVFIGPPAEAIRAMGAKSEAKRLMEAAGVPVVPGYHGEDQREETLLREARRIGFPVLIKASAGGGGRGMRRADDESAFAEARESARREAQSAFGDDRLLLERWLIEPRHIEIQIFADDHGACLSLFERDCSIQRRHQKVIEEAPAPGMTETLRRAMCEAAIAAARAVGYRNAGTVEFILDRDGAFYFMEMNTRLQVEHPVTEMITGHDLVEWQLRVAAGEALPVTQEKLSISGHAIEARLYAEDPEHDFLPAIGTLTRYRTPEQGIHVRVDTGVREGDRIGSHYDAMLAKLIVWDNTRADAIRRMKRALAGYTVAGVTTNRAFLASIIGHPTFADGCTSTAFIEQHRDELLRGTRPASRRVLALAALGVLLTRRAAAVRTAARSGDPWSPWSSATGWRLNEQYAHPLVLLDWGREVMLTVHFRGDGYLIDCGDESFAARGELNDAGDLVADIGGARVRATFTMQGRELAVVGAEGSHRLLLQEADLAEEGGFDAGGRITSTLPGLVTRVLVAVGDEVERGRPLMKLEAMKMEHTIAAPAPGRIASIHYQPGDQVSEDVVLIEMEE